MVTRRKPNRCVKENNLKIRDQFRRQFVSCPRGEGRGGGGGALKRHIRTHKETSWVIRNLTHLSGLGKGKKTPNSGCKTGH